jgi:hypothetical protein
MYIHVNAEKSRGRERNVNMGTIVRDCCRESNGKLDENINWEVM